MIVAGLFNPQTIFSFMSCCGELAQLSIPFPFFFTGFLWKKESCQEKKRKKKTPGTYVPCRGSMFVGNLNLTHGPPETHTYTTNTTAMHASQQAVMYILGHWHVVSQHSQKSSKILHTRRQKGMPAVSVAYVNRRISGQKKNVNLLCKEKAAIPDRDSSRFRKRYVSRRKEEGAIRPVEGAIFFCCKAGGSRNEFFFFFGKA